MLFFISVFVLLAAGVSWLVMFLWNAILPDTLGVKQLTFWKAAGLLLLARILFGSFGRPGRRGPGKPPGGAPPWKKKWMAMSPDEREAAKARWKEHCNRKREE
ncbi:MAG: hypothetical protein R3B47_21205 [Bacteroidia bacterium]